MNEIRKMYNNVGFDIVACGYDYPYFTAERQLSLMAFLINRKVGLSFKAEEGEITVEAISKGLAGIVNKIWQDLTEEEKEQIRKILK